MLTVYRILRPLLFRLPAEAAHAAGAATLETLGRSAAARAAIQRSLAVQHSALVTEHWGIRFPNPVGLAAGFDKEGRLFNALGALGFGFVEIGTVTALPQPGNPSPRLFRLPADGALLNRMGFNNAGAEALERRLAAQAIEPVLGINLGKSKAAPLDRATDDYLHSLERVERFARYLVVNVSSPNTPGLRSLQDGRPLRSLLAALMTRAVKLARQRGEPPKPLLLKIAPDLSDGAVDEATDIALEVGVSGIVATNTTVSRVGLRTPASDVDRMGAGGVSGAPLRTRATEVIRRVFRRTDGALPVIGVGGIFDANDAYAHLRAGARLVQLYTGFVYGGPTVARDINRGLLHLLARDGARHVGEVVGSDA